MFKLLKHWKESFLSSLFCMLLLIASAQEIKWHDVLKESALKGRVKPIGAHDGYARLPLALKGEVRDAVWNLGQDAAGVYVEFKTSAASFSIRYQVAGGLNMPHMPTTGVSGLDLYTKAPNEKEWNWIHGKYSFKDTIGYTYEDFGSLSGNIFRLYLPLYNSVKWMEIGVAGDLNFIHQKSKPIIVYGTSIAQGACASRPGLGWTNWMGRNFDHDVVNLAFSGNGRLEQPILDLIKQEDAAVFILDCIPNLSVAGEDGKDKLTGLINNAVKTIREKHPKTPIVIAAHSSSEVPGVFNMKTNADYQSRSRVAEKAVKALQGQGDKNLYWLSEKEIGLDRNSTVDYAHPNDYGMEKIAAAYTKLLKSILK
ncbi:SGNH/GDSL hydrolase family protein [Sphingobacterium sp.]|uniref:SGNH/GDSL hydrolase family protein n=1 Tax=Sphingobacterium sp. TaxID=341027 RepID=UPI0028B0F68F|nr:SGNH/GDSL hydrolase family protein [Sphingobacterium sp.]